eukprot:gene6424-biopygen1330
MSGSRPLSLLLLWAAWGVGDNARNQESQQQGTAAESQKFSLGKNMYFDAETCAWGWKHAMPQVGDARSGRLQCPPLCSSFAQLCNLLRVTHVSMRAMQDCGHQRAQLMNKWTCPPIKAHSKAGGNVFCSFLAPQPPLMECEWNGRAPPGGPELTECTPQFHSGVLNLRVRPENALPPTGR